MKSDNNNIIVIKTKAFALKCIDLYKTLIADKEFVMSRQFLKSGTSIGANVREAIRAQSDADFGAKMNIALKEASETEYWLELLYESGYIASPLSNYMISDCQELIKILTSIVKTTFSNIPTR